MTLQQILGSKGGEVLTISPDATLQDAVDQLVRHNIGSLVVCEGNAPDKMVGIITERDILKASATQKSLFLEIKVSDVMTTNVITVSASESIENAMGQMTERRIRHLPILDGNRLVGMVSIGDVVKIQHARLAAENHHLKEYIQG